MPNRHKTPFASQLAQPWLRDNLSEALTQTRDEFIRAAQPQGKMRPPKHLEAALSQAALSLADLCQDTVRVRRSMRATLETFNTIPIPPERHKAMRHVLMALEADHDCVAVSSAELLRASFSLSALHAELPGVTLKDRYYLNKTLRSATLNVSEANMWRTKAPPILKGKDLAPMILDLARACGLTARAIQTLYAAIHVSGQTTHAYRWHKNAAHTCHVIFNGLTDLHQRHYTSAQDWNALSMGRTGYLRSAFEPLRLNRP